jgi:type II secretory pathway pseudopilin PulG
MPFSFKQLFIKIEIVEVPVRLRTFVLEQIAEHERKMAKRKAAVSTSVAVLSFSALVAIFGKLAEALERSGSFAYLQLLFTRDTAILSYWRELGFSLVESIPAFTIAAFLIGLILFLWSGIRATQNIRTIVRPSTI